MFFFFFLLDRSSKLSKLAYWGMRFTVWERNEDPKISGEESWNKAAMLVKAMIPLINMIFLVLAIN